METIRHNAVTGSLFSSTVQVAPRCMGTAIFKDIHETRPCKFSLGSANTIAAFGGHFWSSKWLKVKILGMFEAMSVIGTHSIQICIKYGLDESIATQPIHFRHVPHRHFLNYLFGGASFAVGVVDKIRLPEQ